MSATHGQGGVLVAQIGARRHYAVPRILARAGLLKRFETDLAADVCGTGWLQYLPERLRPAAVRRLLGRETVGIDSGLVRCQPGMALAYWWARARAPGPAAIAGVYFRHSIGFCERVAARAPADCAALYGFNGAALELLKLARARGQVAIMEQTSSPVPICEQRLQSERRRNPGWEVTQDLAAVQARVHERERAEWDAAHSIICGSQFVIDGIAASGGPSHKCVLVPSGIAIDPAEIPPAPRRPGGRLRVLSVGRACLLKGTPYVLGAAEALSNLADFRLVGVVDTPREIRRRLAACVELPGAVPRAAMRAHYAWADVFLLPSNCEGSAMVTYEALAAGLPVICTRATGSMVREGVDGLLVPEADSAAIVAALRSLIDDPTRLVRMQAAARESRDRVSLDAYAQRLTSAVLRALQQRGDRRAGLLRDSAPPTGGAGPPRAQT